VREQRAEPANRSDPRPLVAEPLHAARSTTTDDDDRQTQRLAEPEQAFDQRATASRRGQPGLVTPAHAAALAAGQYTEERKWPRRERRADR
jgi:hypothetical protein